MIDTDKYDRYSLHTKKKLKRNWRLKVTQPDIDNSVEAFNGYDTDMPMQGYEDIVAVDSLGRERYTVAQMVDTGWEDAQLIADAPLLLEEVKRLREAINETADLIELVAHTEHQRAIVSRLRKVIE